MTAIGIHAHPTMKLGKAPPRHDERTFHLAKYIRTDLLPKPPHDRDWNKGLGEDLGMMGNDNAGDCGFAAFGHAKQTWTGARGLAIVPTTEQVLAWYAECTGYDGTPESDNGVVLLDALNYARKKGLIGAFMKVDHHHIEHCRIGVDLFGGLYTGAGLPLAAQTEEIWGASSHPLTGQWEPYSWGGHCMWSATFIPRRFTFVTWGKRKLASVQWWLNYVDEAYVLLGPEWVDDSHPAPNGFDLNALRADLAAL